MPRLAAMIDAVVQAMPFYEHSVVGRSLAREQVTHGLPHMLCELSAGVVHTSEGVAVLAVPGEMHQLVGELIVVLQGVHKGRLVDTEAQRLAQREPQEFRVVGGKGELVGRTGDEVVGQVGADCAGVDDVVDGEVQLLEGEAADLAHHGTDQLVRGL